MAFFGALTTFCDSVVRLFLWISQFSWTLSKWITEWPMFAGISGDSPDLFAEAKPPRASCPRPCPDDFWIFPWIENPQSLLATCASVLALSQQRSLSRVWGNYLYISLCLFSFPYIILSRAWLSFCYSPMLIIYTLVRSPLSLIQAE